MKRLEIHEREMKEVIDLMTKAVQSVTDRDERYEREIADAGQRLRSVAGIQDLTRIRKSILASATSLTACVERIADDGRESLRRMRSRVEDYRARGEQLDPGLSTLPAELEGRDVSAWRPASEHWAERALLRFSSNRRELRDALDVIGKAIEAVAMRDERYSSDTGGIAQRLRSIASFKDLARIHSGVIDSAACLTACVQRITDDGRQSARRLQADAEQCRSLLGDAERSLVWDLLTDLSGRNRFLNELNLRVEAGDPFCIILVSLHDFNRSARCNIRAAEDLIRQFALELRTQFPSDPVARCREDQFAVLLTTSYRDAEARVHRIRRSALGAYRVEIERQFFVVELGAEVAVVQWNGVETAQAMLSRASLVCRPADTPEADILQR